MYILKGFTKKAFLSIPELADIAYHNNDINFYGNHKISILESKADYSKKNIFIGLDSDINIIINATLHEIGHCVNQKENILEDEIAAWEFAENYAELFGLSFDLKFRDEMLKGYRLHNKDLKKRFLSLAKEHNLKISTPKDKKIAFDILFMMESRHGDLQRSCERVVAIQMLNAMKACL